jgi:hypothetical protein
MIGGQDEESSREIGGVGDVSLRPSVDVSQEEADGEWEIGAP